jgi:hypothetical protein
MSAGTIAQSTTSGPKGWFTSAIPHRRKEKRPRYAS